MSTLFRFNLDVVVSGIGSANLAFRDETILDLDAC